MNLDELKNRISKLDDTLDKTNKEVKIDIAKSKTAQTRLLRRYIHPNGNRRRCPTEIPYGT